jgi:hypothetical protein
LQVKKKAITQAPILPSRLAAMQVLDGLRRQQNEQLLAVLEEEQVCLTEIYVSERTGVCVVSNFQFSAKILIFTEPCYELYADAEITGESSCRLRRLSGRCECQAFFNTRKRRI